MQGDPALCLVYFLYAAYDFDIANEDRSDALMIIGGLVVTGIVIVFFVLTNGEKPVERMQDSTLQRLENIYTRQVVMNMNAGNLGTDKDMQDHERLKAVRAEIQKRSAHS